MTEHGPMARLFASLLLLIVWLSPDMDSHAGTSPPGLVLFYDPDANHEAIVQVSEWFNDYFIRRRLPLVFRPVQTREAFEKIINDRQTLYAIVSAAQLNRTTPSELEPILIPSRNGDVMYRKVLLTQAGAAPGNLTGKTIATTITTGDFAEGVRGIKQSLKQKNILADNAHFVSVLKDVDALLALAYGQVDAALVTPGSLELLKRISPGLAGQLHLTANMSPQLRAPLCRVRKLSDPALEERLLDALREMRFDPIGNRAMKTLGFDSWVDFSPRMLKGNVDDE